MTDAEERVAEWEDDGYRAIGRWLVQFSRLIGAMRANMENRVRRGEDSPELAMLPFAGVPAGLISDSFFGMCRLVGELTDPEENIANQLQKAVGIEIQTRNKIAHGDWLIGQGPEHGEDPTIHAYLMRTYATAPHYRVETFTARDLDKRSRRLQVLGRMVWIFGAVTLGSPLLTVNGLAEPGTYRVSDVLIAENVPKSGKGGQVLLGGSRASELL